MNINAACLCSEEYTTPRGNRFRAEAYRYNNHPGEDIVYTGYRWEGYWRKVPCFTRGEEAAYPKRLAQLGTALVDQATASQRKLQAA